MRRCSRGIARCDSTGTRTAQISYRRLGVIARSSPLHLDVTRRHCALHGYDADFSTRWNRIKRHVTQRCGQRLLRSEWLIGSKHRHRESTLWQRRFWEHVIRDDADYRAHVDYIHFNPVKHGHVKRVIDWPYSSFHRYVKEGVYEPDWGVGYDDNRNVGEPVSCPLLGKRVGTKSVPTLPGWRIPPFAETIAYVPKVMAFYRQYLARI